MLYELPWARPTQYKQYSMRKKFSDCKALLCERLDRVSKEDNEGGVGEDPDEPRAIYSLLSLSSPGLRLCTM